MDIKQRIEIELRQIAGSTASGADIHALLTDALARIVELEQQFRTAKCIVCAGEGTVIAPDRAELVPCPECRQPK